MKKLFPVILMIWSCSSPSNTSLNNVPSDQTGVIFPHPAGYAENGVHSKDVIVPGGFEACIACHGDTKAVEPVESCFSCHENFSIHESGDIFRDPAKHGPFAISDDYRVTCVICHGATLEGGKYGPSCYGSGCHTQASGFPHMSAGMSGGEVHGPLVFSKGVTACLACHDVGMAETGKKECFDCHDRSWVHTRSTYGNGAIHRTDAISKGPMKYCLRCHGSDLYGGKSGKSCYGSGCHDYAATRYPHNVANWADGERVHGVVARQVGETLCLQCHSLSVARQKGIKACVDCHD